MVLDIKTPEKRKGSSIEDAERQLRKYYRKAASGEIEFPQPDAMPIGIAVVKFPDPDSYQVKVVDFSSIPIQPRDQRPDYRQPHSFQKYFPNASETDLQVLHHADKRNGDPTKAIFRALATEEWTEEVI